MQTVAVSLLPSISTIRPPLIFRRLIPTSKHSSSSANLSCTIGISKQRLLSGPCKAGMASIEKSVRIKSTLGETAIKGA